MNKKVLIVEDNYDVFNMLIKGLDSTFDLIRARSVVEALGAVEEDGPFDCFVVDLSILAKGLTTKEMADFQRREGYAFLKNYLWQGKLKNYEWEGENPEKVKDLKSKTVICSRYVNDFKKENRSEVDSLQMILKDSRFENKVVNLVKKICQ